MDDNQPLHHAMDSLLPEHSDEPTDEELERAFLESVDRRERNSREGGEVIKELQRRGRSLRYLSDLCDGRIGKTALGDWTKKPPAD